MHKRISEETRNLIYELFDSGLTISNIAKKIDSSYSTVRGYISTRKYGFSSIGEYLKYRIRQRGFSSISEYQNHLIKKRGFSSRNGYEQNIARKKGFNSRSDYRDYLVRQRGFSSISEYEEDLAGRKGFSSRSEYRNDLARRNGFSSINKYQEYLAKKRQNKQENKLFSKIIKGRLSELNKTNKWLADQLGINDNLVSLYVSGKSLPIINLQTKLLKTLELPYKTLEDIIADSS